MSGPRFSYHYIERVKRASLSGMTSNSDIARVLQRADPRITVSIVVSWREEYQQFDRACNDALDEHLEDLTADLYAIARDGSESALKYMLDRIHPFYMPKSKSEQTHKGEGLDDLLNRRTISNADLEAQGVIKHRPRRHDDELDE